MALLEHASFWLYRILFGIVFAVDVESGCLGKLSDLSDWDAEDFGSFALQI